LAVAIQAAAEAASVEIASEARPGEVKGALSWTYEDGIVTAQVRAGTVLEVK